MKHWWSGWPGAYCLHCFCEDPFEIAIGNSDYDPYNKTWKSEEKKIECEKLLICPGPPNPNCPCPECKNIK